MPEWDHHEASDDDVHGKGCRHLGDCGSELRDGAALPLVPVRVGLGVVGAPFSDHLNQTSDICYSSLFAKVDFSDSPEAHIQYPLSLFGFVL